MVASGERSTNAAAEHASASAHADQTAGGDRPPEPARAKAAARDAATTRGAHRAPIRAEGQSSVQYLHPRAGTGNRRRAPVRRETPRRREGRIRSPRRPSKRPANAFGGPQSSEPASESVTSRGPIPDDQGAQVHQLAPTGRGCRSRCTSGRPKVPRHPVAKTAVENGCGLVHIRYQACHFRDLLRLLRRTRSSHVRPQSCNTSVAHRHDDRLGSGSTTAERYRSSAPPSAAAIPGVDRERRRDAFRRGRTPCGGYDVGIRSLSSHSLSGTRSAATVGEWH